MASDDRDEPIRFECIRCGACCSSKEMLVTVTGRDVSRIALALGLDAGQMLRVIDFYLHVENDPLPLGLRHIDRVRTEKGLAILALKKNEVGACVFLENNLCLIHPARPGVCRAFPFVFFKDARATSWGLSALNTLCPGLGQGPEVHSASLHEVAEDVLEDISIYSEFVQEWNEQNHEHSALFLIESILSDIRFLA